MGIFNEFHAPEQSSAANIPDVLTLSERFSKKVSQFLPLLCASDHELIALKYSLYS
jgi:hypothetical protein